MIGKGQKVQLYYTLKADDKIIKSNKESVLFEYVFGDGTFPDGLEIQLAEMPLKEDQTFILSPQEAYGMYDPKAVREVPKPGSDADIDWEEGKIINLENKETRHTISARILEVKKDSVILDFNHPLAGKTLQYDIKIMGVE